jgi:hypothetical protein
MIGCGYTVRKMSVGVYVVWSHTMDSSNEIQKELWRKEVRPDFNEFVSVLTHEPVRVVPVCVASLIKHEHCQYHGKTLTAKNTHQVNNTTTQ